MIFRSDDGENPQPDNNGCGFFRFMGKKVSIFSHLKERKNHSSSRFALLPKVLTEILQAAPINQPHKNKDCPGNEVNGSTGTDTTR
jgi:hypothetical protein